MKKFNKNSLICLGVGCVKKDACHAYRKRPYSLQSVIPNCGGNKRLFVPIRQQYSKAHLKGNPNLGQKVGVTPMWAETVISLSGQGNDVQSTYRPVESRFVIDECVFLNIDF